MTGCFRCGGTSHWAEACPTLTRPRAGSFAEHQARIDEYAEWWIAGRIDAKQKQTLISDENRQWHGGGCRPALTR